MWRVSIRRLDWGEERRKWGRKGTDFVSRLGLLRSGLFDLCSSLLLSLTPGRSNPANVIPRETRIGSANTGSQGAREARESREGIVTDLKALCLVLDGCFELLVRAQEVGLGGLCFAGDVLFELLEGGHTSVESCRCWSREGGGGSCAWVVGDARARVVCQAT